MKPPPGHREFPHWCSDRKEHVTVAAPEAWADRALCPWCLEPFVPPVIPDLKKRFEVADRPLNR